jgi:D-glycero-alpha-D-manno-heptose-7-phosphate kinase
LPNYYLNHGGGAVLSMSIRKYVYLSMHEYFNSDGYILKYSGIETPNNVEEIQHRIIRQVFSDLDIKGVDFNSSADVPAGTGLGSSSAFTVGLLNLCNTYRGIFEPKSVLAQRACDVELVKLKEPIGKQDQYGCAMGGINFIEFHPDDTVTVEPIPLANPTRQALENNLVMFFIGGTRSASALLAEQNKNIFEDISVVENTRFMVEQARALRRDLSGNIDCLGEYLHEGWKIKRQLAKGISNPEIDEAYALALGAGATGGKLLGAGGSGFLMVYVPGGDTSGVRRALKAYRSYEVAIDRVGASIIYAD